MQLLYLGTHTTHKEVNNDNTQHQQSTKTKFALLRQSVLKGMMTMEVSLFLNSPLHLSLSHCGYGVDRLAGGGAGVDNDWRVQVSVLLLSCSLFYLSQISHIHSFSSLT